MFAEIVAVVLAVAVIAAYFERKALKADVVLAEGRVKAAATRVTAYVRTKELTVRDSIAKDIATIVADVKAWEAKETVSAKEVIAQFEARIKQIL